MRYEESILKIVNAPGGHLTAEEVFFKLKEEYPAVVMATVYNNLNKLYEQGRIRKVKVDGEPDRYDNCMTRHDHLICAKCGKITDAALPDQTKSLEKSLNTEITGYDLRISHICPECRKTK